MAQTRPWPLSVRRVLPAPTPGSITGATARVRRLPPYISEQPSLASLASRIGRSPRLPRRLVPHGCPSMAGRGGWPCWEPDSCGVGLTTCSCQPAASLGSLLSLEEPGRTSHATDGSHTPYPPTLPLHLALRLPGPLPSQARAIIVFTPWKGPPICGEQELHRIGSESGPSGHYPAGPHSKMTLPCHNMCHCDPEPQPHGG